MGPHNSVDVVGDVHVGAQCTELVGVPALPTVGKSFKPTVPLFPHLCNSSPCARHIHPCVLCKYWPDLHKDHKAG